MEEKFLRWLYLNCSVAVVPKRLWWLLILCLIVCYGCTGVSVCIPPEVATRPTNDLVRVVVDLGHFSDEPGHNKQVVTIDGVNILSAVVSKEMQKDFNFNISNKHNVFLLPGSHTFAWDYKRRDGYETRKTWVKEGTIVWVDGRLGNVTKAGYADEKVKKWLCDTTINVFELLGGHSYWWDDSEGTLKNMATK